MQQLGTKAETLKTLYNQLKHGEVLSQYSFTSQSWEQKRNAIISEFQSLPWNANVIVRSSSLIEDTHTGSQAGKYESVANVREEQQLRPEWTRKIVSITTSKKQKEL